MAEHVFIEEKIQFITFMDDTDPKILLAITYNESKNKSYFRVLCVQKNKDNRFFQIKEKDYKAELVQ